jgi:hypothetical protein
MPDVCHPVFLRQQRLHRQPQQLAAGIAEELFGPNVDQDDGPVLVNDDNGVGQRFDDGAERAGAGGVTWLDDAALTIP